MTRRTRKIVRLSMGGGGVPDMTLHWTMSCGNDALDLHVHQTIPPTIPEPADFLLVSFGLPAFAGFRWWARLLRFASSR